MTVGVLESRRQIGRMRTLLAQLPSAGIRYSVILASAMIVAGGMDYAVNVLVGRWLQPVQYGVFVSITALLQVVVFLSIAIRSVVGFYTAEVRARGGPADRIGSFLQHAWRWAWQWGLLAMALMALLSPFLARSLRLSNSWPLWAASLMVLMLFLRETTYGALQGIQSFGGLGLVQVIQAFLRIAFAATFVGLGFGAAGAIFAQPLSCIVGLLPALWWLRPYFQHRGEVAERRVSWHYSAYTFLGLAIFGVLTNLDALFVKHFFSPQIAGYYGPVVTLAKISLFLPWAIGIILVPKVTQRRATGHDPRPILLLSLTAAITPGLFITTLYFLLPGTLVAAMFSSAYADPGSVLGLASLAATLYAGLNIWLNYALALERPAFIYSLAGVLLWQVMAMFLFGREHLVSMTMVMVSAGLIGNVAGFLSTWSRAPTPNPMRAEAAVQ
jgi:O-antigen/teichoic acid export membrane protein